MGDKGNVYYCSWRREPDGTLSGWESRRPSLRSTAKMPEDLQDNLTDLIVEQYNDFEPAINFDPPLFEEGPPEWFVDQLIEVSWNASFHFRPSASRAFSSGRCPQCGCGLGSRSNEPLLVDELSDGTDGAYSPISNEPPPAYGMPAALKIISANFLECLTDAERETFDFRPVQWANRSRRKFFELIPRYYASVGVVKGLEVMGWQCEHCSRLQFGHGGALICHSAVCRQHFPSGFPEFFFAGSPTDVHLICTRKRWKELVGGRHSRKLTGHDLIVVNEEEFEAQPLLPKLKALASKYR